MDDVLLEKIREYRKMLKIDRPDLDMALLLKILDITNESSEVFIAIEPVSEAGDWVTDTPRYAVCGVTKLDDGRIVLRTNSEKHGMEAGELNLKIKKALKRATGSGVPVLFVRKGEVVQLTEAFSHSLLKDHLIGLPFDLILGVRKRSAPAAEETAKESSDDE